MSKDSFLYMQVYTDLKEKIEQNILQSGEKLPTDDEMKEEYKVSTITLKKALTMLKEEGLIQRVPGVGTFVQENRAVIPEEESVSVPQKRKSIGLILEHVSDAFGLDLMYHLDQLLYQQGYQLIVRFSYYQRKKETEEIEFLMDMGISGLVVMPCHGVYYNPKILKLILEDFPVVMVDKKLEGISVPVVRTDNKEAVKALVRELVKQGHKKIGLLSVEGRGTSSVQERQSGFMEALEELELDHVPECVVEFDENVLDHRPLEENVNKIVEYLRAYGNSLDSIVCTEFSLVPVVRYAANVIRFDLKNVKLACVDGPANFMGLHMKQDEAAMAEYVAELLLQRVEKKKSQWDTDDVMVPAIMIEEKKRK